ncbi:MAG: MFS transporter [Rhodospirillaceae bacterium]|nr:MFS transporter [Rhodospirillaceae bacterium]
MNEPQQTGWHAVIQGSGLIRISLVMSCVTLHAMDVFVIATILPSVVQDIDGVAFYAWPAALYIVTSIMGAASGGIVGTNLGLRRALTIAATIYLAGSIVCALAPQMWVFLIGRAIQGLGSGLMVALAYAMVRHLFDEHKRPHVFAYMSVIWGLAALVGPILAGALAQLGFWRGVYWLTILVFALILTLARRALPQTSSDMSSGTGSPARLPWERLVLLGAAILCVTISGQTDHLGFRLALIIGAVFGVGGMLWLDHIADNPLLPSRPTSLAKVVGAGYWIFFLISFSFTPLNVFLPLLAQRLHEVPPSLAGYVSAAMSLGWSAAASAVAGATPRWQRILIVSGPLCVLAGIAGQSIFVVAGPVWGLIGMVFLTGLGIGQCHAHVSNQAMSNARTGEEALTASAIPTMQSLGFAFGAATAGLLASISGMSAGISVDSLTSLTEWIYGFALFPAVGTVIVALRLYWLIRPTPSTS